MEDINAVEIEQGAQISADVCIVGTGAAGMTLARSLARTTLRLVVMESGGHKSDEATQSLTDVESVGEPIRAFNENGLAARIRCLGGTTNTWGGRCARLHDIDFAKRDWVDNSGWPIKAEELAPFYDQAETLLKLPGKQPSSVSPVERAMLRDGTLDTVDFSFASDAVNMKTEYALAIRESSNAQFFLNANAIEVEPERDSGSVSRIHFRSLSGNAFSVVAKKYVIACGGWENARLLLLSRRYSDAGLGNPHDVVGRYYQEHPILREGAIEQPAFGIRSPQFLVPTRFAGGFVKQGLRLSDAEQTKERLLNHYVDLVPVYDPPLHELPYARKGFYQLLQPSIRSLLSGSHWKSVGAGAEFFLAQVFRRTLRRTRLAIVNHLEQAPNRESRVTPGEEKDALGLNRLRVDRRVSAQEKESLIRFHEVLRGFFQSQNVGEFTSNIPPATETWDSMTDAFHHMGTTRMSCDAKTGVVDKNCKVHGIDNLYLSGSSVFPTCGCVNPTLTIVALALRLGNHVIEAD